MAFNWPSLSSSSITSILYKTLISFCRNYSSILVSNFPALSFSLLMPVWSQKYVSSCHSSYRALHCLQHSWNSLSLYYSSQGSSQSEQNLLLLLRNLFPTPGTFSCSQSGIFLLHQTTKCSKFFHTAVLCLIHVLSTLLWKSLSSLESLFPPLIHL